MEHKIIEVRGARVHNLKNIDVNIPLGQIVGIALVSGSGKTTVILESLVPGLIAQINGIADIRQEISLTTQVVLDVPNVTEQAR